MNDGAPAMRAGLINQRADLYERALSLGGRVRLSTAEQSSGTDQERVHLEQSATILAGLA